MIHDVLYAVMVVCGVFIGLTPLVVVLICDREYGRSPVIDPPEEA